MRIVMCVLAVLPLLVSIAEAREPKTEEEKTLYAIGLAIARNLGTFNLTKEEVEMVKEGLTDGVTGKKPKVEMETYGPKIQEMQQQRLGVAAQKEKDASKGFLAKAAAEKGAVKSDSGLVYVPIKNGKGASPKASDVVKVHYVGTLTNGKEFDSSVKRGEPATFPLAGVIPCWTEGLQKMKVGGKSKLVCPSDIAYGDHGRPPQIPPGATLVFEVELLDIMKEPQQ